MAVNVAADADVVSITTTTAAAMAHNLNPFHMNECSRKQMNSIRSHTHTHSVDRKSGSENHKAQQIYQQRRSNEKKKVD